MSEDKNGIRFGFTPQSTYRDIAESQRKYLREAADRIERGESLDGLHGEFIAVALRAFADRIPDEPPKRRGRQPIKLNPGGLALHYVFYVKARGMSKTRAIAQLAEEADVSIEAVKKALKTRGDALIAGFNVPFIRKTK